MGEARNQHFEDQRQHLAQGSCSVLAGMSIPISRFPAKSGPRFPFPAESGIGDSLIPDFGRIGNRGFPPRFPAKSGIGGTGIGDLGLWSKDGDGRIFINSDAKRDAEDSVWRLLGPGSDSELIRPRCALRRDSDALTLRAGWKHGPRLTSLYKLEESQ